MPRCRYRVTGRVQGVGFRFFTREQAQSVHARGWARNRPDGSVEIDATADDAALERFEQALRQGPPMARVRDIERRVIDEPSDATGFTIR